MQGFKGKVFFWSYLIVVLVNLVSHGFALPILELISKPLLMPLLAGFVLVNLSGAHNNLKLLLFGALLFSWIGDVALLFDKAYPILFIVGLGGFLVAHIQYIFLFVKSAGRVTITKVGPFVVVTVIILYTGYLIQLLWPHLNELKIPVAIYALVLMIMGISAVTRIGVGGRVLVIIGALFFVVSDSILAINKFYEPIQHGRILTMFTYTIAQLLIVLGIIKVIGFKSETN